MGSFLMYYERKPGVSIPLLENGKAADDTVFMHLANKLQKLGAWYREAILQLRKGEYSLEPFAIR